MKHYSLLLLGVALGIAALALVLVLPQAGAWQSGDVYPGTGAWTVTNPTILADQTLTVAGNVTVNGQLNLYNATLRINSASNGQYVLNVTSTGALYVYAGNITAASGTNHYKFIVYGTLGINQSAVSEMWGDTASYAGGIQLYSDKTLIENSTITLGPTGGISIWNCSATILSNNITGNGAGGSTTYCYGIFIRNSEFTFCTIKGNRIHNNTYASGTSRYGTGIRSEYQNPNDTIESNTIADNGWTNSTTTNGNQIYLYYSNVSMKDNIILNGKYQIYSYWSRPPVIRGGRISSYINLTACYHVYSATPSDIQFDGTYFTGTYLNNTFYGIYSVQQVVSSPQLYSNVNLANCTFEYPNSALGTTWTAYIIQSSQYSPLTISNCTFLVNMPSRLPAPSPGSARIYLIYAYTYSPVNITDSKFSCLSAYYNYGIRAMTNSPMMIKRCTLEFYDMYDPSNVAQTVYGVYTATNSPMLMEDCDITYSMTYSQYYGIYLSGSNNIIRNTKFAFDHNSSATRKWSYGIFSPAASGLSSSDTAAKVGGDFGSLLVENCTGTAASRCTGLYGLQWLNCGGMVPVSVVNCSFVSTNSAGFNAMGAFSFNSNTKAYINSTTFDMDLGGGTNATPGTFLPIGLADIQLLELNNSTVTYRFLGDSVDLPLAYIEGTCGEVAFRGSRLEVALDTPGSSLTLFRFMRISSGVPSLAKFTVVDSTLKAVASSENCALGLMHLWMGSSLASSEMRNADISLSLQAPSTLPSYALDLYKVKSFGLANFTLDLNAPADAGTVLCGMRLQLSSPTVTNITFQGNGAGAITGLFCDLVSRPTFTRCAVDSAQVGLRSEFYSLPTLSAVKLTGVDYGLVVDRSANASLTGSRITAGVLGVSLAGASWATLVDTAISGAVADFSIGGDSTCWLVNCSFAKNPQFTDEFSRLVVCWWLDLGVTWQNGVSIPGAGLLLRDRGANDVLNAVTGGDGRVPTLPVIQYIATSGGSELFGPYTGYAARSDLFGSDTFFVNSSIEKSIIIRDDSPPALTVVEPSDGHVQADTWLYLIGTASDRGSGLESIMFSLDGTAWSSIPPSARWEHGMEVPEGRYDFHIKAVDVAGNEAEIVLDITIDLTPPFILVDSPANGSTGNSIIVHLQGRVEPGSRLSVNFAPAGVAADGTFSFSASLVEGTNLFTLRAQDRAGLTNISTITLKLDITPPVLVVSSPADNLLTNLSSVMVTGRSEPGALVKVNGQTVPVGPDGSFSLALELSSGPNTITVTAADAVGNTATATRRAFLDDSLLLSVTSPSDGFRTNRLTVLVRGTADPDALVRLNGGVVTLGPDGAFEMSYVLAEGTNQLVFEASDLAGNRRQAVVTVVLDTTPPDLALLYPPDGAVLRSGSVQVRGTAEAGATVTINGKAAVMDGAAFTATISLPEGASTITVEGRDQAGNLASLTVTVTVDLTAPPLSLSEPPSGFQTPAGVLDVSGSTEPGATVLVNGVPVPVDPDGRFSATVSVAKGGGKVTVTATDAAGNEATRTVSVDVSPGPSAPAENPWSGIWTPSGQFLALGILLPLLALAMYLRIRNRAKPQGGD